jgi:hypothetical protein
VGRIQPRYGEDKYPLGRLVLDRASDAALSRSDLVRRLRYIRIGKGHQALHTALITGVVPPQIAKHLAEALELDEPVVAAVIAATERQRRDEAGKYLLVRESAYRAAFKPCLRTETDRARPEPIFIAAMIGTARLRHVGLPDEVWLGSAEHRDRALKLVIQAHYRDGGGWVAAFGTIIGYSAIVVPGYGADFGFAFDVDGNRVGGMRELARLGEATLGLKRGDTRLTALFRNSVRGQ